MLLKASAAVKSVSTSVIASFVEELWQDAVRSQANFWEAAWVIASLLATSLALSSRLSAKVELGRELSSCLSKAEWQRCFDERKNDSDTGEAEAMVKLLQQCGINAPYK